MAGVAGERARHRRVRGRRTRLAPHGDAVARCDARRDRGGTCRDLATIQRELLLPRRARAGCSARSGVACDALALLSRARSRRRRDPRRSRASAIRRRRRRCRARAQAAGRELPLRASLRALLDVVRRAGATILSTATTVEEARWLEERGVHAIIAQGLEAGGHRGHFLSDDLTMQVGTFALVPQIARAVRVPVIAAGGIADAPSVVGRALARRVGGAGRHLVPPLSRGDDERRASRRARERRRPPHRADESLLRPAGARDREPRDARARSDVERRAPLPARRAAITPLRTAAERAGRGDFSPLWAGQNASGCRAAPAAEITRGFAEGL